MRTDMSIGWRSHVAFGASLALSGLGVTAVAVIDDTVVRAAPILVGAALLAFAATGRSGPVNARLTGAPVAARASRDRAWATSARWAVPGFLAGFLALALAVIWRSGAPVLAGVALGWGAGELRLSLVVRRMERQLGHSFYAIRDKPITLSVGEIVRS